MKMKYSFVLIVLVLFAGACALIEKDDPAQPTCVGSADTSAAGSWQGSINSSLYGSGTLTVNIQQTNECLSGAFTVVYSSAWSSGKISGTIYDGGGYSGTLSDDYGSCPSSATGTVSGSTMTGTFNTGNCTPADNGTFSLTKL